MWSKLSYIYVRLLDTGAFHDVYDCHPLAAWSQATPSDLEAMEYEDIAEANRGDCGDGLPRSQDDQIHITSSLGIIFCERSHVTRWINYSQLFQHTFQPPFQLRSHFQNVRNSKPFGAQVLTAATELLSRRMHFSHLAPWETLEDLGRQGDEPGLSLRTYEFSHRYYVQITSKKEICVHFLHQAAIKQSIATGQFDFTGHYPVWSWLAWFGLG